MGLKVRQANARLAQVSRTNFRNGVRPVDKDAVAEARDQMLAARLEEAIDEALHPEAPYRPLSKAHRTRLSKYLLAGK